MTALLIAMLGVIPIATFVLGWRVGSSAMHSSEPGAFTLRRAGRDKRLNLDATKPNRRR